MQCRDNLRLPCSVGLAFSASSAALRVWSASYRSSAVWSTSWSAEVVTVPSGAVVVTQPVSVAAGPASARIWQLGTDGLTRDLLWTCIAFPTAPSTAIPKVIVACRGDANAFRVQVPCSSRPQPRRQTEHHEVMPFHHSFLSTFILLLHFMPMLYRLFP